MHKSEEKCCCIFENPVFPSTAGWLSRAKSHILEFDKEAYHFLSSNDRERARVVETIKESGGTYPPCIGALVSKCKAIERITSYLLDRQIHKISLDDLNNLAENTRKIIVGAYDGEGYVIWNKE